MRLEDLNLDAMPEPMRRQIAAKVALQAVERGRKYHNTPTESHGIRFDSKREAAEYDRLLTLYKAGKIQDLRLQPEFTLQEAWTKPDGERVRAIRYRADFSYRVADRMVIVDVKSEATRKNKVYAMKRKMMAEKGLEVIEIA